MYYPPFHSTFQSIFHSIPLIKDTQIKSSETFKTNYSIDLHKLVKVGKVQFKKQTNNKRSHCLNYLFSAGHYGLQYKHPCKEGLVQFTGLPDPSTPCHTLGDK